MKYDSLNYHRNKNGVVITNSYGRSIEIPKPKKVYRDKDDIVVISSLGQKLTVDKYLIKHRW